MNACYEIRGSSIWLERETRAQQLELLVFMHPGVGTPVIGGILVHFRIVSARVDAAHTNRDEEVSPAVRARHAVAESIRCEDVRKVLQAWCSAWKTPEIYDTNMRSSGKKIKPYSLACPTRLRQKEYIARGWPRREVVKRPGRGKRLDGAARGQTDGTHQMMLTTIGSRYYKAYSNVQHRGRGRKRVRRSTSPVAGGFNLRTRAVARRVASEI